MQRRDRPREAAVFILREAERGSLIDPLLDDARTALDSRDNAFLHELIFGVLRNRALLDWTLDRFSEKPVGRTDGDTRNILRLGLYQLLFLDRVPASAAVNTATEIAKERGGKSGYVNGLLRTLERNKDNLSLPASDTPLGRLSVLHSHPSWLVRRWIERYGSQTTEELLRNNNRHAPLVIRANRLKIARDELLAKLAEQGVEAKKTAYSLVGIEIVSSPGLTSLPAFKEGRFFVQDESAQLVGMLLGPQPGERVLDACAAPGGKATHIAELMGNSGEVVALESEKKRIGRISENSMRLGITIIKPVVGDAAVYKDKEFDRVLVDAPCSGLGVLRRHPDGRWTKNEESIRERAKLQAKILAHCARLVKPGGVLVYATCTTEPEENEEVVKGFLAKHPAFTLDEPLPHLPPQAATLCGPDRFFRTFPQESMMDGFFGARLVRAK